MTCLLSIVAVALLAMVGGLGYFVFFKNKTIAITQTEDGVVFSSGDQNKDSTTLVNPSATLSQGSPASPRDPVMEAPPGEDLSSMVREPVSMDLPLADLLRGDSNPGGPSSPTMKPPAGDMSSSEMTAEPPEANAGGMDASSADGDSTMPEMSTPEPSVEDGEEIRRQEIALKQAAQLIRDRDWDRMVTASEKARNLPLSGPQERLASGLYSTAFLFEYYHGAIQRGYAQLESGSTIKLLPPDVEYPIVSVDGGGVTLMVERKNETYSVDQLPFVIADHLALPIIENDATRELSAAIYHCLAANSTLDVQKSELAWIRGFDREVKDVDVQQVSDAIEMVLRGR